jgi:ABC-2 type transport system permease protein
VNALRNIGYIVQKEWRHYFASPIAYVALCAWALLFGIFYSLILNWFVTLSMRPSQYGPASLSLNEMVIGQVLRQMAVVALFIMPMVTMRLFAEEKRQGTIELLATSPITDLEIVLGKFFAALGLYAVMIVSGFVNFALLWSWATNKPEWKPLVTGALALLLLGACFVALGLFISSLTRNQIVAGVLTFCLFLGLWAIGWMDSPMAGRFTKAVSYVGLTNHLDDLIKGVVSLKDVVYYLSVIVFGLFLTHQSVESHRWRA